MHYDTQCITHYFVAATTIMLCVYRIELYCFENLALHQN